MGLTRKKYVVDKKFQYRISIKAITLPLTTTLIICGILLYFANYSNNLIHQNNQYINEIVNTQDDMIDMFLSTPALNYSKNPIIKNGVNTFKSNIGKLKNINDNSIIIIKNSSLILYILIIMTILQTIIIFSIFIVISHKISGPIQVMSGYLKDIKEGNTPKFRSLRKNDELQKFYNEFNETISYMIEKKNNLK